MRNTKTYTGDLTPVVEQIENNLFNPSAIYHLSLNTLTQYTEGNVKILDASHPVPYCLEWSSVTGAVTNSYIDSKTRQLYATLAQNEEDLNRHMSDRENYDRFATPVNTEFHLLLDKLSIKNYAVSDSKDSSIKKIIIPQDTRFKINDMYFGIHYPIVIRYLDNGNITVMWDIQEQNPIYPLASNEIEYVWRKQTPSSPTAMVNEILDIKIPVHQFQKTRYVIPANQSTGFVNEFTFDDQYYLTRVYTGDSVNGWEELHTTYSYQVYNNDDSKGTALLQKYDNKVRVEIPQIYFSSGLIGTNIRVDVYTTKGNLSINFSDYDISLFTAEWLNSEPDTKKFSEPLNKFALASIYSTSTAVGGSNGLTYEQTRNKVINNQIETEVAMTPDQLNEELDELGYDMVTYKDYITENLYLATKTLPEIYLDDVSVTASSGILIFSASIEELVALDTVIDNGSRLTITPDTLYKLYKGVVQYCTNVEKSTLEGYSNNDKVVALNNTQYLYSPYHYVYDNSTDYFEYRGYYLDNATIANKFFQNMNDTTDLQVSTKIVNFNKIPEGWELLLQTTSNSIIKSLTDTQLIPQIYFLGVNEVNNAYQNAEFVKRTDDNEFIFKCVLETNHDINSKHELTLLNFKINDGDTLDKEIQLIDTLNIVYTVNGYTGQIGNSELDGLLNLDFIPLDSKGLTHETIEVVFGEYLDGLFNDYRTISGGLTFLKYQEDIPATYPNDVWETDASGKITYYPNPDYDPGDPTSPPLVGNKLFSKGDDIYVNGELQYSHKKGDPILKDGELIPVNERTTIHECQLFYLDAKFKYATEKNSVLYAQELPNAVISYLNNDILPIQKDMLNLTKLQYYPKKALGYVSVNVSKANNAVIKSTQNPIVNVYVSESVYSDFDQRKLLRKAIKEVLVEQISSVNVNLDTIYNEIKAKIDRDVVSFYIEPLGDDYNLNRYSLINQNESTNIGVLLELQTDGTLKLNDTCTINFFIASENTGIEY